jgi:hypothetical protein
VVDVPWRRAVIDRRMLDYAEAACRRRDIARLVLSTAAMRSRSIEVPAIGSSARVSSKW